MMATIHDRLAYFDGSPLNMRCVGNVYYSHYHKRSSQATQSHLEKSSQIYFSCIFTKSTKLNLPISMYSHKHASHNPFQIERHPHSISLQLQDRNHSPCTPPRYLKSNNHTHTHAPTHPYINYNQFPMILVFL